MAKDHYHQIDKVAGRVRVYLGERLIADSCNALLLKEVADEHILDPAYYLPKEDLQMIHFTKNDRSTSCPIKGEASYWDYTADDGTVGIAAWSYEEPVEYSEAIRGRLSFDRSKATIEISPD